MSEQATEELLDRIESAIADAFEGQGEAWSDTLSGDRLAYVAREAVRPLIAGAEWQASRKVEAPTGDRESLIESMATRRFVGGGTRETKYREPWFLSNDNDAETWCITDGVEAFPIADATQTEFGLAVKGTTERASRKAEAPDEERGRLAEVVLAAWDGWPDEMDGAHPAVTIAVAVSAAGYRKVEEVTK